MMRRSAKGVLALVGVGLIAGCQVLPKQNQASSGDFLTREGRIIIDPSAYPLDPNAPQVAPGSPADDAATGASPAHRNGRRKANMWNPATSTTTAPLTRDADTRHSFAASRTMAVAANPLSTISMHRKAVGGGTTTTLDQAAAPAPPKGIKAIGPTPDPSEHKTVPSTAVQAPPDLVIGVGGMMK